MKKFLKSNFHIPVWLFILLLVVFILRIPSLFEPYSYGDEMIYLTLGNAIRKGVVLYKGIYDNKPPLLYLTAALAGSLFWFKAILAIWNIITVFLFWKLSEALFNKNPKIQKISTIIFAIFTTIPLLEGNIANAEIFMIGPIIGAFLLLFTKKKTAKNLFLAGVLFSFAALFKIPAAFDFPVILFLYFISLKKLDKKSLLNYLKECSCLVVGFLVPIILSFIFYLLNGAFKEYLTAAFLQNFGYLSSWRPGSVRASFLVRNGPLLIRFGILVFGLLVIYLRKSKLSKNFIFLSTWILFGLFAVTLSERPYPHYLLQVMAPTSFLLGMLFVEKTSEQVLTLIPLFITFFVPFYYKFWIYDPVSYYIRFAKFSLGAISKESYLNSFNGQMTNEYNIASFITTSSDPKDKIFVWGSDAPTIYALTRRLPPEKYVADYHIKDFSSYDETLSALKGDVPEFVVVLGDDKSFDQLDLFLIENYGLAQTYGNSEIWKLLTPQIRSLIAH